MGVMLHPLGDKTREELDKLLHTDDMILMHLLCLEFDSKLLFAAACLTWLHSVTHLKYVVCHRHLGRLRAMDRNKLGNWAYVLYSLSS